MGDFNYHVNWDTIEGQAYKDKQFLHYINDEFLTQLIRVPTRGQNTLDLLLTSEENIVYNIMVGECFGTSDRQMGFIGK